MKEQGSLARRYLAPPFSVIRASSWMSRKRQWLSLGIQSELGRGGHLVYSASCQPQEAYMQKHAMEITQGRKLSWKEYTETTTTKLLEGTSVFDPTLCEMVYRWFCPPNGQVFDPFAGGSVRGVVAAALGHSYTGIDLRHEQNRANRRQWQNIKKHLSDQTPMPDWRTGDACQRHDIPIADLVFTCPPYADLERYSDNPKDLSTMDYVAFKKALHKSFMHAYTSLSDNRFFVVVISDLRDSSGVYRGLVADTIKISQAIGLSLYNDIVFIPPYGSLPMRAGLMFRSNRKVARAHQHVLVFVKGNWRKAVQTLKPVRVEDVPHKH